MTATLTKTSLANINSRLLAVLHDYSNSFNLYNVVELSSNRTGGNGVQVETENEKFTVKCSRSPQNLEYGHFVLLLAEYGEEMCPNL